PRAVAGRAARAGRAGAADHRHPVGRAAPPARPGAGHGARARRAVPRRADHRARSAQPGEPLVAHPRAAGGIRHHDLPDHALSRGSRRIERPDPRHRRRPDRRRGHHGSAQAASVGRRDHRRGRRGCLAGARGAGSASSRPRGHDADAADAAAGCRARRPRGGGRRAGAAGDRRRHRGDPRRARQPRGRLPAADPPRRRPGGKELSMFRDTVVVFRRYLRLSLRNPIWIFVGLVQPVVFLVFFGPLMTRTLESSGTAPAAAWQLFVPGILVQLSLFSGAFVGFAVIAEWRAGVIERLRVTPVSRLALLLGRVLRDVAVMVAQAVVLILTALPFGLRAPLGGVLISLGLVALLALSLTSLSYA